MTPKKQISLTFTSLFLLFPYAVSAATVSLQATPVPAGVGDVVRVSVLLDSTIPDNAFSGTLIYSAALEPLAINDGNSIISMWITRPAVTSRAPMTFAGITPGGFSGNAGVLFSVLFRVKVAGMATVSLKDVEILRNDGAGGKESVVVKPLIVSLDSKSSGGYTEPDDSTPPESFTAYLGSDAQLFDGRNYLVFSTVDKSSGVDHYTIVESRVPSFLLGLFKSSSRVTTSPYMVADQNLTSTIYITAMDRAGNEQLSIYPPQHLLTAYEKVILLGILIVVVLLWRKRGRGRRFGKNL